MRLSELRLGERARVRALKLEGPLRRRLRDLGLVEGAELRCLGRSPLGDPSAYVLCGAVLALRRADCSRIEVEAEEWSGS